MPPRCRWAHRLSPPPPAGPLCRYAEEQKRLLEERRQQREALKEAEQRITKLEVGVLQV